MLRRLVRFLFPASAFKREAPVQTPGDVKPQTREEYLRELENDPYFEEITGEQLWEILTGERPPQGEPVSGVTLIVSAAHRSASKSEQPPGSH